MAQEDEEGPPNPELIAQRARLQPLTVNRQSKRRSYSGIHLSTPHHTIRTLCTTIAQYMPQNQYHFALE